MTPAALLLILGGIACTALSMRKHYDQVFGPELRRRTKLCLRSAGWALLGLALVPCVLHEGPGVGVVAWTGLLTVGTLVVTALLTYHPQAVFLVATTGPPLAIVLLLLRG